MSTDCENLLKKLLVLNPGKRGNLQVRAAAGRQSRVPEEAFGLHPLAFASSIYQFLRPHFRSESRVVMSSQIHPQHQQQFTSSTAVFQEGVLQSGAGSYMLTTLRYTSTQRLCFPLSLLFFCFLPLCQQVMKDRWMNVAYEDKELEPYKEPEQDFNDLKRIGQTHNTLEFRETGSLACLD